MMDNPISILIIDDSPIFLKAISAFIEDRHESQIRVLSTASNGKDGIRLARQLHPQVVLLDLQMPDMHGFFVIPLLRQILPEVKIIATTGLSFEDFALDHEIYYQECLKAGADFFIPKHRLDKDLASAVLEIINTIHRQDGKLVSKAN
jgi:two-component system nitrate/nitrite response regulator NarL